MTWTKISDDLPERLEVKSVGRSARWLLIEMTVYANRLGLDGKIPRRQLRRISDADDVEADLAELVAAGAAEVHGEVVEIDWSDQLTAAEVEKRRDSQRTRQERHRRHQVGDHSLCSTARCGVASPVTRDTTRDRTGDKRRESRPPVPSRPDPKESGRGACAEHPHEPAKTCRSCWADVRCGERDESQIGQRLKAAS